MRAVAVEDLKPEMVLARSIYTSDGRALLMKGVQLKPFYVQRLKECGITFVYIQDDRYGHIEVDDVVREETRVQALQAMRATMEESAKGPVKLQSRRVSQIINDIMDELLAQKELLVQLTDIRSLYDYTFGHCVSVAVFALMTGISMGYNQLRLKQLGVGALLHDVGKSRIAPEIINKPGRLTDAEYAEIRKHTVYGYEILVHSQDIHLLSAHVAFQHHERFNGTGYPRGLKGEEIHEYARITAVADVYDAMSTDRSYRKRHLPHEVVEFIVASSGSLFDPQVVKTFIRHVALYPVGTVVKLNTGQIGIVIKAYPDFPTRPRVRLVRDPHGQELSSYIDLDLTEDLTTFIVEVLPSLD
ncbi:MAG: HD-GYP domain-containing protein [Bacillota bacterium]|nr:HD-GYP domain-containing protein [Bacillota bacterium]